MELPEYVTRERGGNVVGEGEGVLDIGATE